MMFLAEAFTRPKVMARLAEAGFSQSYTYFTWRTEQHGPEGLWAYLEELAHGPVADYMRPNFWPNTPDILSGPLRLGPPGGLRPAAGPGRHPEPVLRGLQRLRAVRERARLGHATRSTSTRRSTRSRIATTAGRTAWSPLMTPLNDIRRRHPALHRLRSIRFHPTTNPAIVAYSKVSDDGDDAVLMVVNLDPYWPQDATLQLDLAALGLPADRPYRGRRRAVRASATSGTGRTPYVRLDPDLPGGPRAGSAPEDAPGGKSRSSRPSPRWYQRAVFYEILVRGFFDGNDDGTGDLRGHHRQARLSPVAGRRLPLAAAVLPVAAARRRLRHQRLLDRPARVRRPGRRGRAGRAGPQAGHADHRRPGHEPHLATSTRGSWSPARTAPTPRPTGTCGATTTPRYPEARVIFVDTEKSNWTFDAQRGQYYWHRFFSHQPDLNYDNPEVADAMLDVVRYWLDIGLDGFRLDAVPYLFERDGTNCENLPETHEYLQPAAQGGRLALSRAGAAGRGQPVARGRRRVLRRRRRVPHVLPLPGDAPDVHGRAPRAAPPHHRDPGPHPGDPRRAASGGSSCATTTS